MHALNYSIASILWNGFTFFDIWNQFKRLTTDAFSNFFSVFIVIIIRDAYRTKDVGPLL